MNCNWTNWKSWPRVVLTTVIGAQMNNCITVFSLVEQNMFKLHSNLSLKKYVLLLAIRKLNKAGMYFGKWDDFFVSWSPQFDTSSYREKHRGYWQRWGQVSYYFLWCNCCLGLIYFSTCTSQIYSRFSV